MLNVGKLRPNNECRLEGEIQLLKPWKQYPPEVPAAVFCRFVWVETYMLKICWKFDAWGKIPKIVFPNDALLVWVCVIKKLSDLFIFSICWRCLETNKIQQKHLRTWCIFMAMHTMVESKVINHPNKNKSKHSPTKKKQKYLGRKCHPLLSFVIPNEDDFFWLIIITIICNNLFSPTIYNFKIQGAQLVTGFPCSRLKEEISPFVGPRHLLNPEPSTHCMANVGKYNIHWVSGYVFVYVE